MKKLLFTALFISAFLNGYCQTTDSSKVLPKEEDYPKIFTKVEKEAMFPGGSEGWKRYLEANLNAGLGNKYIRLKKNEIMAQQTIKLQFIVNKDGKVSNVMALHNPDNHPKLAAEAVRVIKEGPNWLPAEQNNRKVTYQAIQYITFQVEKE